VADAVPSGRKRAKYLRHAPIGAERAVDAEHESRRVDGVGGTKLPGAPARS
jgi:hypothetical protein